MLYIYPQKILNLKFMQDLSYNKITFNTLLSIKEIVYLRCKQEKFSIILIIFKYFQNAVSVVQKMGHDLIFRLFFFTCTLNRCYPLLTVKK